MGSIRERVELASASRTTTQTGDSNDNQDGASTVEVVVDVTTAGTGSITASIQVFDLAKNGWVSVLSSAAITTISTTRLIFGPAVPVAANKSETGVLGRQWRVVVNANNANAITYSVSSRTRSG